MALNSEYNEARERWTWRRQVMDDGMTTILSKLRVQKGGGCSWFALAATLEPNLRVQWKRSVSLSILHLKSLHEESYTRLPNVGGRIKRLLLMLKDIGVFEESQYEEIIKGTLSESNARRYKVIKYYSYNVKSAEDIKQALYQLRRGGPLLAVIRISSNYRDCKNSGLIYRFDPNRVVNNKEEKPETHAVCVVSFAMEAKVPYLECQDSRGVKFGRDGFIAVDITSLIELYAIRIHLSSS